MIDLILAALVGLSVGSFLNVCIYRIPEGMSLVLPPSSCPACNAPIKPWDNIPVVSYLLLRGKCRSCRKHISIRYPLIEIFTGLLYGTIWAACGEGWIAVLMLFVSSAAIVIVMIIGDASRSLFKRLIRLFFMVVIVCCFPITSPFADDQVFTNDDLARYDASTMSVQRERAPRGRNKPLSDDTGTEVSEHTVYYDIRGATVNELSAQIKRLSPVVEDGKRYAGRAVWGIKWKYDFLRDSGYCSPRNIKVDIEIIFTYPKWGDSYSSNNRELINKWQTYMRALELHENGHKQIALDGADEFLRTMKSMRFNSCDKLKEAARSAYAETSARIRTQSREYDQSTRHGTTQGAHLP